MIPTGKFHLLTAATGCLKLINYEKTDHESGTCPGKRQSYVNRIPMRYWAEDDLPSQKLLLKGNGSLSDAELLSIIIGSGVPGKIPLILP